MNLNRHPTLAELRDLLARCDDRAGHHVLWVDPTGEVHLTRLPRGWPPSPLPVAAEEVRLRCETFHGGNGYVGPEAACDEGWLAELFDALLAAWASGQGNPGTIHLTVDQIAQP